MRLSPIILLCCLITLLILTGDGHAAQAPTPAQAYDQARTLDEAGLTALKTQDYGVCAAQATDAAAAYRTAADLFDGLSRKICLLNATASEANAALCRHYQGLTEANTRFPEAEPLTRVIQTVQPDRPHPFDTARTLAAEAEQGLTEGRFYDCTLGYAMAAAYFDMATVLLDEKEAEVSRQNVRQARANALTCQEAFDKALAQQQRDAKPYAAQLNQADELFRKARAANRGETTDEAYYLFSDAEDIYEDLLPLADKEDLPRIETRLKIIEDNMLLLREVE